MTRVLVVDDDGAMRALLDETLSRRGFQVTTADGAAAALAVLARTDVDVVLTDVRMKGTDGIALTSALRRERATLPVVIMTAFGSMEIVVDALRAGARDFIVKPFDLDVVVHVLHRAIDERRTVAELKLWREPVLVDADASGLLGTSAPMQRLRNVIADFGRLGSNVLITGESGTGKELVARALHNASRHKDGPFVAVNVSALPETLLESQLFGHTRGAFTDAREARRGVFAEADGGTLFLDEIGDLPLALQPKLLRVLQERRFRPLGSDRELAFTGRVVSATHKNLEAAIDSGTFREDLFFRLDVLNIHAPPLRDRGDDIVLLARTFLQQAARRHGGADKVFAPDAEQRLRAHSWPGNVRELHSTIERTWALTASDVIGANDLAIRSRGRVPTFPSTPQPLGDDPAGTPSLAEVERRHILAVLAAEQNNRQRTAEVLGIARRTLYRRLLDYGYAPDSEPEGD
jgi:DNA-binding NtrC family response regulator